MSNLKIHRVEQKESMNRNGKYYYKVFLRHKHNQIHGELNILVSVEREDLGLAHEKAENFLDNLEEKNE